MNETKQNELKELMGVQKPAKEKFDEYCHMLEHQYNPKTETKQFNANKKLVQSIRGMYIDYEDVEKSNVELGSGAFGVAYKGKFPPMHFPPTHFDLILVSRGPDFYNKIGKILKAAIKKWTLLSSSANHPSHKLHQIRHNIRVTKGEWLFL